MVPLRKHRRPSTLPGTVFGPSLLMTASGRLKAVLACAALHMTTPFNVSPSVSLSIVSAKASYWSRGASQSEAASRKEASPERLRVRGAWAAGCTLGHEVGSVSVERLCVAVDMT